MNEYIAYCGLDCETCEARIATVNDDNDLRAKVAKEICWHNSYTSGLNQEITKGVISSLYSILDSLEFDEVRKMHTLRSLRGFVEGFSMLELHGSFVDEISLDESFAYGVDALISGIMKGQENVG